MHFVLSTVPHSLQWLVFLAFDSHCSHMLNIVSLLHLSQKYVGNSAWTNPASKALWKDLILPPSLPIGNSVCGSPSSFLTFAFSGLPILAPIKVPDLSLSFTGETKFITPKASSDSEFLNLP